MHFYNFQFKKDKRKSNLSDLDVMRWMVWKATERWNPDIIEGIAELIMVRNPNILKEKNIFEIYVDIMDIYMNEIRK